MIAWLFFALILVFYLMRFCDFLAIKTAIRLYAINKRATMGLVMQTCPKTRTVSLIRERFFECRDIGIGVRIFRKHPPKDRYTY
jgi:hypothetical protein